MARFNNVAAQHKQSQQLNPFSDSCGQNGNNLLKPKFGSEDYGRWVAHNRILKKAFRLINVNFDFKTGTRFFDWSTRSESIFACMQRDVGVVWSHKWVWRTCRRRRQSYILRLFVWGEIIQNNHIFHVFDIKKIDLPFQIYTRINDKLVGLLLRARKHEFIAFEGECLFQVFISIRIACVFNVECNLFILFIVLANVFNL